MEKLINNFENKLRICEYNSYVCRKNKNSSAGGKKTNKNGLSYENITDLSTEYKVLEYNKYHRKINFIKDNKTVFIETKKSHLFKYMSKYMNKEITKAHGCKFPDECFINEITKTIFIIEKKFQQVSGSVCEKIQTPDFKIWQYNRTFPKYNIVYIYCLSEWFKKKCKAEIEYLKYKNIPVFFSDNEKYKNNIIDFIINYK